MHRRDLGADTLAIRLRPTRPDDLPALFELQADPESNHMAGTKPRTREVFFAAWERNFANPGINSRVIEIDGEHGPEIVGSIARFQAEGEGGRDCVGYWIARAHWGKGVASRGLMMFLGEERRRPLHATTASTNAPSRRILEKGGFRCVGLRMGEETERFVAREIADFVLE
jgi:RimJ/RimL family protein N-acetyltransferase